MAGWARLKLANIVHFSIVEGVPKPFCTLPHHNVIFLINFLRLKVLIICLSIIATHIIMTASKQMKAQSKVELARNPDTNIQLIRFFPLIQLVTLLTSLQLFQPPS